MSQLSRFIGSLLVVNGNPRFVLCEGLKSIERTLATSATSFPANQEKRLLWLSIFDMENGPHIPRRPDICSDHFSPYEVVTRDDGRRHIKLDAIPLLNPSIFVDPSSSSSEYLNIVTNEGFPSIICDRSQDTLMAHGIESNQNDIFLPSPTVPIISVAGPSRESPNNLKKQWEKIPSSSSLSTETASESRLWTSCCKKQNISSSTSSVTFSAENMALKQKLPIRREFDVVVVGGGIVGAASAREMKLRHPNLKMAIVEKESELAKHQTGHNSGVIHAGIYYKPGSLKAKLCVEGMHLMYKYCDEKKIPYKKVGKLIVATDDVEVKRLEELHQRAIQNKVPDIKLLKGVGEIQKIEPHCVGLQALWSPHTGIIDYSVVTEQYGVDFKEKGGEMYLNFEVNGFEKSNDANYPVLIKSKTGQNLKSKYVLTCGGLQSDKLAEMSGCPRNPRIVPFRGEYLLLNPKKAQMIRGNIYPVPDPRFPFLGVHFTPRMDGSVWLGPNAVLAFKREGYTWTDINLSEFVDTLLYPGFLRLAFKYVFAGAQEVVKSAIPSLQVKSLQKFVPSITADDVIRGPAGVRAQALDVSGNLIEDFVFDMYKGNPNDESIGSRVLHCRNAPSPGATSSLAIAKMMVEKLESEFKL